MRGVFSKSNYLIFIAGVMLFLCVLNAGMVYYVIQRIENDAKIINYAGLIRGSIQRLTKLELSSCPFDSLIDQIEHLILSFENRKRGLELKKFEKNFINEIGRLKADWNDLKSVLFLFRKSRTSEIKKRLLDASEKCWSSANRMVFTSQFASESKVNSFGFLFVVIGLNILVVLLVIDMVRNYVKEQLEVAANYDTLTHVHNRYSYSAIMDREMKRSRRYSSPLSLIMFDIDHFKIINDTYGHKSGDSVLKEVTTLVQQQIRESDYLCRIGGEEFAIITIETHLHNALLLAEKLRSDVESHNFADVGRITLSFGVAEHVLGDTQDALFKRADAALYRAKEKGRNRIET